MSLNIKNARTHALAREVAGLTGENVTQAVTVALEERLQRLRRRGEKRLSERLMEIGRDAAPHFREPYRSIDHGDFLYDERGLPK
jgi:antitoxin VapB